MIEQLTSDDVPDSAYEWLCRRRRDYSANADVWALRRCWPREKEEIKGELLSLLTRITLKDGEDTDLWSARNALVLKALALVLGFDFSRLSFQSVRTDRGRGDDCQLHRESISAL